LAAFTIFFEAEMNNSDNRENMRLIIHELDAGE